MPIAEVLSRQLFDRTQVLLGNKPMVHVIGTPWNEGNDLGGNFIILTDNQSNNYIFVPDTRNRIHLTPGQIAEKESPDVDADGKLGPVIKPLGRESLPEWVSAPADVKEIDDRNQFIVGRKLYHRRGLRLMGRRLLDSLDELSQNL